MDAGLGSDVIRVIASFLSCKDAIKICYLNKACHAFFLIPVFQSCFVCINTGRVIDLSLPLIKMINLHIDGFKKLREPLFQYIERTIIDSSLGPTPWSNLKYISFGNNFNARLNYLPRNVECIRFEPKSKFNQNISFVGCWRLRRVYFGKAFNRPIDNLPESVEVVYFVSCSKFNQSIARLPKSLKEIYFGNLFNKDIGALVGLCKLAFSAHSQFDHELVGGLISRIEVLILGMHYCRNLHLKKSNLRIIRFHKLSRFNCDLVLPATLEHLFIGEHFNRDLELPQSLLTLGFYAKARYNRRICLPPTCYEATLGRHFTSELECGDGLRLLQFAKRTKYTDLAHLRQLQQRHPHLRVVHGAN